MEKFDLSVTFDQFDNDDGIDYGIINAYWSDHHFFDVFDCEAVEDDGMGTTVEALTGLDHVKLTLLPFNPYGDGREWQGHGYANTNNDDTKGN